MTRFEWAHRNRGLPDRRTFPPDSPNRVNLSRAQETDELALLPVFNASPWDRDEVITVDVDIPEYLAQAAGDGATSLRLSRN